ncbi:MAG: hypothetical protein Q8N28_00770 [bacterium]|nr:hypothetical protein [bacterium]
MIDDFINFFTENLLVFQIVSLFVSTILLSFIIYFIAKLNIIGEKIENFIDVLGAKDISKRRTLKAWKQIQRRLKTGELNQLKLAILEADKVLYEVLKMIDYQAKNFDEILEKITEIQLSNIKEIRHIHKLRHRIASEPDFQISVNEAEMAIEIYKRAFQELKLIE